MIREKGLEQVSTLLSKNESNLRASYEALARITAMETAPNGKNPTLEKFIQIPK